MLAKGAVPVQTAFPVHGVNHVLGIFIISKIVSTIFVQTSNVVFACVRVILTESVPIRLEVALDSEVRETREVEQGGELQTLGDEAQVLIELQGSDHL